MLKVFSTESCGYCSKLKAYLDSKGVSYDVVDVAESRDNYDRLIKISGQTGVPVTVAEDGRFVIGFDVKSIEGLIGE